VVHDWFAVHDPQFPFPSQTMLVPQLRPPILLLPSTQVTAPLAQDSTPFLQTLGLPVQEPPAVQETHAPAPLQTMLVPQPVPGALLPPSTQVIAPVMHEVTPFLQMFGFDAQEPPALQVTQLPFPLQTRLVPQAAPADLLVPSTHVRPPVLQEVTPFLQGLGFWVHEPPAVQETQLPEPLQTMLVPQETPGPLLVSSTQAIPPEAQEATPFLHAVGFVVQALPAVQETHAPAALQTMLTPQLVPAAFIVPFAQVAVPLEQDAVPLKHGFGLPEQAWPSAQLPQNPRPSHTWLLPQGVPAVTLPVPSTQVCAPVVHEMTPLLHGDGLPPHEPPAAHMTQVPVPLQTMLVPQPVPAVFGVPSTQVWTPVLQDVTPLKHAPPGFVEQA
jgi:hypothetical protein